MRYVCEIHGCDRPVMNNGKSKLCAAHYQRKRRGTPDWDKIIPDKCEECDTPINTRPRQGGGKFKLLCQKCWQENQKTLEARRKLKKTIIRRRREGEHHAPGEAA